MAKGVSALVVSGFLGSGKTTLVRHLLRDAQAQGVRVGVVSNEFGELGIDQALLAQAEDDYVEIGGGCVCCKLADELLVTLQQLWERARPERIIVETSGVALPYDTQLNFWRDPVRAWVRDDFAVVVVNAEQLEEGRDLEGTFEDQVSSAELLLLNKTDLVSADRLGRLEDVLREMAPGTPVVRCVEARVDPALLFPPEPGARSQSRAAPTPAPHRHEDFTAQEIRVEEQVDPDALRRRLEELGAVRVKGFVRTSAGLRLVQGVGARIEITEPPGAVPDELVGALVAIQRTDRLPRSR